MGLGLFNLDKGVGITGTTADSDILNGTDDPSVVGVVAPISSVYYRDEGTSASMWQKVGPADTDWTDVSAAVSASGVIGAAEDGSYTDGLFTDFVNSTPTGTAVDRFNEVLKSLAPSPAPDFSEISCADTGVTAKLSFGASNGIPGYINVSAAAGGSVVDINGIYAVAGARRGCFSGTTINGTINDQVVASGLNYPDNAFAPGNSGVLSLEVNGIVIHITDLSVFGSGTDVNLNGSGFNLSASTPVQFESGDPFESFQYRTGTWTVSLTDQVNGFNYVRVIFTDGNVTNSNYYEWVNDPDADALIGIGGVLDNAIMVGSRHVSGVEYHTGGTAAYDCTIQNIHENVYSTSSSAVSFQTSNCSATAQALGNIADETDDEIIVDKLVTINSGRLLDASITVGVNGQHPLKADLVNGTPQVLPGILIDTITTANTVTNQSFNEETYRIPSDTIISDQASIAATLWDETQSITTGAAGYTDGLLQYNGAVRYPTQGLDGGDFRTPADGNLNGPELGPVGNPDYSTATGNRVILMKFQNNTGLTKANFVFSLSGTSSFTNVPGVIDQSVSLEMKFPDGSITTGTGWMDCYEDFATGQWLDGDGCRDATNGVGRAIGIAWGMTVGTKSIANGEWIILRLTAASTWTGNISNISLTWS